MAKLNKKLKIFLFTFLEIFILFLLTVGSYIIYVFAAYYRLEDNLSLDIITKKDTKNMIMLNTEYSAMTFNVGFCASDNTFSFFMDGGDYSRARSKEILIDNMEDIASDIRNTLPDITIIQEVDVDGRRSYHVNELEYFEDELYYGNYVYSQNYDSPYLFYPFTDPSGSTKAGLLTCSNFTFTESLRRSLPISTSFSKFFDLDRCYSITKIAVNNGKELCIYNIHLSAYGSNAEIRQGQLNMLMDDIEKDIQKGNYVICGGDFNHNLRSGNETNVPEWAQPFPKEVLPTNSSFAFDTALYSMIDHNSCRNLDTAYNKDKTFTVLLDGFIVSSNIEVTYYESLNWEYERSDHDPVYMKFKLLN